jgi:hypothetical protein
MRINATKMELNKVRLDLMKSILVVVGQHGLSLLQYMRFSRSNIGMNQTFDIVIIISHDISHFCKFSEIQFRD